MRSPVLALFPPKKGNGLGVFADANESVAERRFLLILVEIKAHEPPPEEHGDTGADRGIDEEDADKLARDGPEDTEESDQRHDRVDDDEEEIQHAGREELRIFRDTLIGVVHRLGSPNAVVGAVEKIPLNEVLRQPAPRMPGKAGSCE